MIQKHPTSTLFVLIAVFGLISNSTAVPPKFTNLPAGAVYWTDSTDGIDIEDEVLVYWQEGKKWYHATRMSDNDIEGTHLGTTDPQELDIDKEGTKLRKKYEWFNQKASRLSELLQRTQATPLTSKSLSNSEGLTDFNAKQVAYIAEQQSFVQQKLAQLESALQGDAEFLTEQAKLARAQAEDATTPTPSAEAKPRAFTDSKLVGKRNGYGFRVLDAKPTSEDLAKMYPDGGVEDYCKEWGSNELIWPIWTYKTLEDGKPVELFVVDKIKVGNERFCVVLDESDNSYHLEPFEAETPHQYADTLAAHGVEATDVQPYLGQQMPARFADSKYTELDHLPTQEEIARLKKGVLYRIKGQEGLFQAFADHTPLEKEHGDDAEEYTELPQCPTKLKRVHLGFGELRGHVVAVDAIPTAQEELEDLVDIPAKTKDGKTFVVEYDADSDQYVAREIVYADWLKELKAARAKRATEQKAEHDQQTLAFEKGFTGAPLAFTTADLAPGNKLKLEDSTALYPHGLPVTVDGKPFVVTRKLVAEQTAWPKSEDDSTMPDLDCYHQGGTFLYQGKPYIVTLVEEQCDDRLNPDDSSKDKKTGRVFFKKAVLVKLPTFAKTPTEQELVADGITEGAPILVDGTPHLIIRSQEAVLIPKEQFQPAIAKSNNSDGVKKALKEMAEDLSPQPKKWYHHTGKRMATVNISSLVLASILQNAIEGYVGTADKDERTKKQKLRDMGKAIITLKMHKENLQAIVQIFRKAAQSTDDSTPNTLRTRFKKAMNKKPIFVTGVCGAAVYNVCELLFHTKTRALGRTLKSKLGFAA